MPSIQSQKTFYITFLRSRDSQQEFTIIYRGQTEQNALDDFWMEFPDFIVKHIRQVGEPK